MRAKPPVLPGSTLSEESPSDRALQLALAGEHDAALRWSLAILKEDPLMPTALALTGRLLGEGGREEAAREACVLACDRAIDLENLPLAVMAAQEASRFGEPIEPLHARIASAFCEGSKRFGDGAAMPVPLPSASRFDPLPSVLSGMALKNKACELVHASRVAMESATHPPIGRVALFSSLSESGLRELVRAMDATWVPAGERIVAQGDLGEDAFWVARGELEATRVNRSGATVTLARLRGGSVFGEMALLSRSARAGTVTASRPSIIVRIKKDDLNDVASRHPRIATQLGEYCRDRMVQNLSKTADILKVVPESDLPALVARFEIRCFEQHERVVVQDEAATGLFLIASGEVASIRRETDSEPLVIRSLGVGEVVGEVATVLRRKTSTEIVAVQPTVTLFLPVDGFVGLVREHPSILAELYLLAIVRDEETRAILDEEVSVAEDFDLI